MKKSIQRKSESGRSMIEMVGVLAISALVTGGAFILIQSGTESQKRSRAVDEVNALVSAARMATMGTGNYSGFAQYGPVVSSGQVSSGPNSLGWNRAKRLLKMETSVTPFGGQSRYAVTGDEHNLTVWLLDIDKNSCELMERASFSNASYVKCHNFTYTSDGTHYTLTINYTE